MKLPNYEQAIVSQAKITGLVLSLVRPEKRDRAKFFMSFGFSVEAWQVLVQALRRHAAEHNVTKVEASPHGMQYVIDGPIFAPNGRKPLIRSIWFVPTGESVPRFITAHPIQKETDR